MIGVRGTIRNIHQRRVRFLGSPGCGTHIRADIYLRADSAAGRKNCPLPDAVFLRMGWLLSRTAMYSCNAAGGSVASSIRFLKFGVHLLLVNQRNHAAFIDPFAVRVKRVTRDAHSLQAFDTLLSPLTRLSKPDVTRLIFHFVHAAVCFTS